MDTKLHSARTPVEIDQVVTPSVVEGRRRWVLPNDARREKRAIILGLFLGGPLLIVGPGVGSIHPALAVGVAAAFVGTALNALVWVRRLPRLLLSGLIGGGVAGLIAIGAGSRLAMRIVSLTGGRREVTIGGTMFLLIAGAMFGAFLGVTISSMIRIWKVRGILVGAGLTVFPGGGLLLGSDTRTELLHEGAGGWVNIPMFLALFPLFGILVVRAIRQVDEILPMTRRRDRRSRQLLLPGGDPGRLLGHGPEASSVSTANRRSTSAARSDPVAGGRGNQPLLRPAAHNDPQRTDKRAAQTARDPAICSAHAVTGLDCLTSERGADVG